MRAFLCAQRARLNPDPKKFRKIKTAGDNRRVLRGDRRLHAPEPITT
jgi:hypothetical protein